MEPQINVLQNNYITSLYASYCDLYIVSGLNGQKFTETNQLDRFVIKYWPGIKIPHPI
jgi:hypothetical protein